MPDARTMLILAALGIVVVGAKAVGHGVKVGAVKTEHAIVRVFRHPVHSLKNGAIHEPPPKPDVMKPAH